jgi:uncharacterized protein
MPDRDAEYIGSVTDDIAAGDFSSWMVEIQGAIRGDNTANVPCGACTACCTSSQFVHIAPDETDTLAHIPAELRFPAPRLPRGHMLLGYDERGHCPMLIDNACSIYEHRPRTCRTYDCRVFPSAGIQIDDSDKVLINERARQWRFSYPAPADRQRHEAVERAATFVDAHRNELRTDSVPMNATQLAVLAVELHELFLGSVDPDVQVVGLELARLQTAYERSRISAAAR